MFKTFIAGILLGLAAAAGALYAFPAVDQYREASIVAVAPNGGNIESFHINIPMDRIMTGAQDQARPLPAGLEWPDDPQFAYVRTEMFKVRNARDAVIGVAVRTAAERAEEASIVDWMVHFPARGSLFASMESAPREGGYRIGEIVSGSREFEPLSGFVTERWVEDTSGEEDAPLGRIELQATYVSTILPPDPEEAGEEFE